MSIERWFCQIEFTFNVHTEPSKPRYKGDTPVDFAFRAFYEGLRERLCESFPGNDGINWFLTTYPEGVVAKREGFILPLNTNEVGEQP